jgi:hypothetical protein
VDSTPRLFGGLGLGTPLIRRSVRPEASGSGQAENKESQDWFNKFTERQQGGLRTLTGHGLKDPDTAIKQSTGQLHHVRAELETVKKAILDNMV